MGGKRKEQNIAAELTELTEDQIKSLLGEMKNLKLGLFDLTCSI